MKHHFLSKVMFTGLIFFYSLLSISQIIPDERKIIWTPGISGGVPNITSPSKNILDFGADSTGINDSKNAIVKAIDALPEDGGIIYIPQGRYLIKSTIVIEKNNIVIRGAGTIKTKLFMAFSGDCFKVVTYKRGNWQSINEVSKGVNTISVADGSKFSVGQFAELQQENDPEKMYTKSDWDVSWADNSVGQLFEIKNIQGNQITFKTKVHIDFDSSFSPQIRPQGFVRNVGFEDFYIEKTAPGGNTFTFKNTAYCWIRNVESYHTRKAHVSFTTSIGCIVRDSYFHHSFSYGGGGSGYGVSCGFHTTDVLVENNIFNYLRHAMMTQLGANGNVFGYNYSINNVQGNGETDLNQGWTPPDISIHGHYPFMNLFEGNDVQEIGIGDFWGPGGIGITYFRNKVNSEGIFYYDHSDYQNLLGNITTKIIDADVNSKFKLEHGNKTDGAVIWDVNISNHNLINSYYLSTKPAFFTQLDWPSFGPFTPNYNKLPAQLRFEKINIYAYAGEDESICSGDTIKLKASGGISFKWNTGETGSEIIVSPDTTTKYTVTITDNSGYIGVDEVIVEVKSLPDVFIDAQNTNFCEGDSINIIASGGQIYIWNTEENTNQIWIKSGGVYTVEVTDTNGCSAQASTEIIENELPIVSVYSDRDTICIGDSLSLTASGGISYVWNTGDTTSIIHIAPVETSAYRVQVTDTNGCTNSIDTTITVEICNGIIQLNNKLIRIYPNPSKTFFSINSKSLILESLEIFNNEGQLLKTLKCQQNAFTYDHHLTPGIYWLRIISNNGIFFKELVVP